MNIADPLDVDGVGPFLADAGFEATDVERVGAGAWSSCFGFKDCGRDFVVRFGVHVEDFEKDRYAVRFASPGLPVPDVLAIGPAFDGHFAVSQRVGGSPLEQVDAPTWAALVPAVVEVLERLRTAELSPGGFGAWNGLGHAGETTWLEHLLTVRGSTGERRPGGWRDALTDLPDASKAFDAGIARLASLDPSSAPRSLIHADLINRNVHVDQGQIVGVFDWGCGRYGDHLYDLAWFEFWAPWHREMDIALLHEQLRRRWHDDNYEVGAKADRWAASLLHIGLDHIAFNVTHGTRDDINDVVERMGQLDLIS